MAEFNSTQPSFSSGIISTELFSRIDYSKLESGLKQCENWMIRPAGGAEYRTGTKYICETKYSDKKVSLIPFLESRDEGYCLEFGEKYIRFYKNGEIIYKDKTPVEIVTPFMENEVSEIKFAQDKNKMYLVHRNHHPMILTRNSDTSWSLDNMSFSPEIPVIDSVTISSLPAEKTDTVVNYDLWQYAVSVVDPEGNEGISKYSNIISSDIDLVNQNIEVKFKSPDGLKEGSHFYVYRIFRGDFYFIYKIKYDPSKTDYSFKDISFQIDTNHSVKIPFDSFKDGDYPGAVGFWNQRLIFANTKIKPNTIFGSRVGKYNDFTSTILNNADEAFELTFNSGSNDTIVDIIPIDDLIAVTESKIWRVVGTSPSNMQAYIESYSGSSGLRPFAHKKSILYVDASLNTVSNFIYSYELNGYTGQNLDILCRDLMDGYTIKDITLKDSPFGVLYCVRSDGVLLGLTYLKEENVYAWHMHTTQGLFENVCSINKAKDDDVYTVVYRDGKRYVEMFMPQIDITEGVNDSFHLDCAYRYRSNIYKWENNTSYPTKKTFYGLIGKEKTVQLPTLYCWGRNMPKPIYGTEYYYNYSQDTYDKNNLFHKEGYGKASSKKELKKGSISKYASHIDLRRLPSFDIYESDVLSPENFEVFVSELSSGATVYIKKSDGVYPIGVLDSYSNGVGSFGGFEYNRSEKSDFVTEGEDFLETTIIYTNGLPKKNDEAYKDTGTSISYGTVSEISSDGQTITVGELVFDIVKEGTGVVDKIGGLSRFNGKSVTVLADGNEYVGVDVIDGQIILDKKYSNILVGLPYTGILEPIAVDMKFNSGSSTVGVNRRINKATIRYYRSRGLWYGTKETKMYEIKPYTYETFGDNIPLETNVLNTEVTDTYKEETRFIIMQKSPFPAMIQSITLGINYGEKN